MIVLFQKENIGVIREMDVIDDTLSVSIPIEKPMRERVMDLFEHSYYEVVITASTLAVVFVLAGLVRTLVLVKESNAFLWAMATETFYLTMFTTEVTIMVRMALKIRGNGTGECRNDARDVRNVWNNVA